MNIKVCGMKDPENLAELLELPIDWVGFIFYKPSPRNALNPAIQKWVSQNPKAFSKVKRVGVFVNAEIEYILNKVHDFTLDYVQLHGDESPEYCNEIISYWDISTMRRAGLIKAFPVDEDFNFESTNAYAPFCNFFLFDTRGEKRGGNGYTFDWSLLDEYQGETPFILGGGIDEFSDEAIKAIQHPQFFGIDLNSRFETAPGIKAIDKLTLFTKKLKKD